jgi:hypothetical protein
MERQQDTQLQGTLGGTAGGVKLQEQRLNYPLRRDGAPLGAPTRSKLSTGAPGTLSGGPNSSLQDPYAQSVVPAGCPAQKCYVDHTDSYATNEVAINWNAPLAWVTAFLDEYAHPAAQDSLAD